MYGPLLSWIHHQEYNGFLDGAAPGVLSLLESYEVREGLVLDLGCGSGAWSQALLNAGYQTWGLDLSADMVSLARQMVPEGTFVEGSLYDVPLPPCQAATALGEVVTYLPVSATAPRTLSPLFHTIAAALAPGGVWIFDLILAPQHPREVMAYNTQKEGLWEGRPWQMNTTISEQPEAGLITRQIQMSLGTEATQDSPTTLSTETHLVGTYSQAQIELWLEQRGFSVEVFESYGDMPLAPRRRAFCCQKRA